MAKSIRVKPKKRGRPATGKDPFYGVRIADALMQSVDQWRKANDSPSRSDAIRRLIEMGLAGAIAPAPRSEGSRRKAADLAGRQIDRLVDQAATDEERASRKGRLLSGPKEFRDLRNKRRQLK
jgi:hypothetical protein